jgi:hypothetical protein
MMLKKKNLKSNFWKDTIHASLLANELNKLQFRIVEVTVINYDYLTLISCNESSLLEFILSHETLFFTALLSES